ncbi:MAG TPA: 5'/3'-nucleotidase SurE, partial [Sulfuricaulis sp.]
AAHVTLRLLEKLKRDALPADTILNVNVPDVTVERLAGFEATRLGHRHKAEPVVRADDPHGNPVYWVGVPGEEDDAGPGTDFYAIRNRSVSITPLHVDLTRYTAMDQVSAWLKKF